MGIFAQVWFWSALAFLAGALLSWALLALPARRQLAQLDQAPRVERESGRRSSRAAVPPLPERPSGFDDDPFDRRRSPFDDEPGERRSPLPFDDDRDDRRVPSPFEADAASPVLAPGSDDYDDDLFPPSPARRMDVEPAARTELMSGVDASGQPGDDAADRGLMRLGGQSVSPPTVQVPVVGTLDEGSLFAPPEPALPSRQTEDEAAPTQFLPAITAPEPVRELEAPPEVQVDDRGWFQETGDQSENDGAVPPSAKDDESLVDDLAVDPRQAESSELVDDVEDIEEPADTGGTIFTQRTQPVSGELISSLDGKAEESSSDPEPAEEVAEEAHVPSSASHPTAILPVRKPGANRFDTGSRSQPSPPKPSPSSSQPSPSTAQPKQEVEATQAMPAAAPAPAAASVAAAAAPAAAAEAAEPDRARSLFEPIVPADDVATQAMPAPGTASAMRSGDGAFVPPGPFGPGSAMPLPGGGSPSEEFTVKASVTALRYCEPDSPLFGRTVAEVWFRTTKDAERVGFRPLS
jgi:hypothetical protein